MSEDARVIELWEEFDCPCGAHVKRFGMRDQPRRCGPCNFLPGWDRDPALRQIFGKDEEKKP